MRILYNTRTRVHHQEHHLGQEPLHAHTGQHECPRQEWYHSKGADRLPPQGGATSPMPIQASPTISRETVPICREYFPRRRRPDMPEPPAQPNEPKKVKRKAPQQAVPVSLKPYRVPRGSGHQLPDEPPRFVPFSGQAQRLPEDSQGGNLRANAIQRMRALGHQSEQRRRGRDMVDRMNDGRRALGGLVTSCPWASARETQRFLPRILDSGPATGFWDLSNYPSKHETFLYSE